MKNTGELLKNTREKKKLTLEEVSVTTKISLRVLRAIEEGDQKSLPAKSFLRGFIKTYASYLELNPDSVIKIFYDETGELEESKQIVEEESDQQPEKTWIENLAFIQKASLTSKALIISSIVFLIILIIVVRNTMDKYEGERTATQKIEVQPINNSKKNEVVTKPAPNQVQAVTPKTEKKIEPKNTVNPEPKLEPKLEPKELEALNKKEKVEEKAVEKNNREDKQEVNPPSEEALAEPSDDTPETPVAEVEKPELPAKPEKFNQEVIIEALDFVEISYRIDGGDLKTEDLKPDQLFTLKAKNYLAIDVSDAGAINVIHNGRDKGIAGEIGQEKKIKYP